MSSYHLHSSLSITSSQQTTLKVPCYLQLPEPLKVKCVGEQLAIPKLRTQLQAKAQEADSLFTSKIKLDLIQ